MAEQKLVPGIKINFALDEGELTARFKVSEGISSADFLTNAEIRATIKKLGLKNGRSIGHLTAIYDKWAKTMFWSNYVPFIGALDPTYGYSRVGKKELRSCWSLGFCKK